MTHQHEGAVVACGGIPAVGTVGGRADAPCRTRMPRSCPPFAAVARSNVSAIARQVACGTRWRASRRHGYPSGDGQFVEQAPQICRRLDVGQVDLVGESVCFGARDALPRLVERRSVGGRSAIAPTDDEVDSICLVCHHIRRRCGVERAEFGVQRSAQATQCRPPVRIGPQAIDVRCGARRAERPRDRQRQGNAAASPPWATATPPLTGRLPRPGCPRVRPDTRDRPLAGARIPHHNDRMTHSPARAHGSTLSLWSKNSFLSIGSVGSVLSIGSVGSVLSVGSVGSALSAGSIGSALSAGSIGSALSAGSIGSALSAGSVWSVLSSGSLASVGSDGGVLSVEGRCEDRTEAGAPAASRSRTALLLLGATGLALAGALALRVRAGR